MAKHKSKAAEERKARIAKGLKDLAENRAKQKPKKKDTRTLKELAGKAPVKTKTKKKTTVKKKKKTAEDMVNELKKNKGRIPKRNK